MKVQLTQLFLLVSFVFAITSCTKFSNVEGESKVKLKQEYNETIFENESFVLKLKFIPSGNLIPSDSNKNDELDFIFDVRPKHGINDEERLNGINSFLNFELQKHLRLHIDGLQLKPSVAFHEGGLDVRGFNRTLLSFKVPTEVLDSKDVELKIPNQVFDIASIPVFISPEFPNS